MKPATHSLRALFGPDVRYIVPLYQRPYVWQEKTHWEPLWQDVVLVAERQLQPASEPLTHFLGAVVLEQEATPPGEIPRHLVIDGQQRLTTLQLLVDAVADEAGADGAKRSARLLSGLTRNNPDLAEGDHQYKLWPTNSNRIDFVTAMSRAVRDATAPMVSQHTNVLEAHEYFRRAARRWANASGAEERDDRYDALRVAISELLLVVSINLEPDDNAQVIFETLNARGTPLLAMDLVKNALFRRAEQADPKQVDGLHEQVWEPELGLPRWREEQRQGRLKRPRAELFLMHWLTMTLGEPVLATELFSTFERRLLADVHTSGEIAHLMRRLCSDAATMRSFDSADQNSVEGSFFHTLDLLDTTTLLPVALALFTQPTIGADQRERMLVAMESWLVRRMLCGLTTKNYNQLALELVRALSDIDNPVEAAIGLMDAWDQPTNRWPRDAEVRATLTGRAIYGNLRQNRLAMVLLSVENRLRASVKTEGPFAPTGKLTIEHVLPQSWHGKWPLPAGLDEGEAVAARNQRVHLIGNLTLTTSELNSSLSNSGWVEKRQALKDHSVLRLNSELVEQPDWTERDIDRRSHWLVDLVTSIWTAPPTAGTVASASGAGASNIYEWTLADLFAAGKLEAGEALYSNSSMHPAIAEIDGAGRVLVNGKTFTSLSSAASAITSTSVNGWRFWSVDRHGERVALEELRAELGEVEEDNDTADVRRRTWSDDDLSRLADAATESMIEVLDLLAGRPGEIVDFSELALGVGRESAALKADLAAFSRLVSTLFERSDWPFTATAPSGHQDGWTYTWPAEDAVRWRQARSAA